MGAHVLNDLKSVRWIRLQKSSTERYSLGSTTGELQVVRDLPLFRTPSDHSYVPLATIRTPSAIVRTPGDYSVPLATICTLSAIIRTLTRLFVTLSGTASPIVRQH